LATGLETPQKIIFFTANFILKNAFDIKILTLCLEIYYILLCKRHLNLMIKENFYVLRLIIVVPFLAVLGIFFFKNEELYAMSFPFFSWQMSVGFFAVLVGLASFVIGALTVSIALVKQWRKVRKANKQVQDLEKKLNELREQYISLTQTSASTVPAAVNIPVQEPVTVIGNSAEADAAKALT